jgi:hypothetical protein
MLLSLFSCIPTRLLHLETAAISSIPVIPPLECARIKHLSHIPRLILQSSATSMYPSIHYPCRLAPADTEHVPWSELVDHMR